MFLPLVWQRLTFTLFPYTTLFRSLVVPSGLTTSSMESTAGASSFWIVPVPIALAIVALVAPEERKRTLLYSSHGGTSYASTGTGLLVSPGAKVSVPLWLM